MLSPFNKPPHCVTIKSRDITIKLAQILVEYNPELPGCIAAHAEHILGIGTPGIAG